MREKIGFHFARFLFDKFGSCRYFKSWYLQMVEKCCILHLFKHCSCRQLGHKNIKGFKMLKVQILVDVHIIGVTSCKWSFKVLLSESGINV